MSGAITGTLLMSGPAGILFPLGIEVFTDLATAHILYNYLATVFLLFIASFAGSRDDYAWCALTPMLGGVFMFFGWLTYDNMVQAVAMVVIATIFGIMIYMNETNRERSGVSGPGSKILSIVFYLIFFQVCLGIMPSLGIFDSSSVQSTAYGQTYCPPSATCDSYSNVQFTQSAETVANTGGFLSGAITVAYAAITGFIAMIGFVVSMIISVVLSATVIGTLVDGLYPGVSTNIAFLAFMGALSVVFWAADVIFIMNALLKLFPSEGSL